MAGCVVTRCCFCAKDLDPNDRDVWRRITAFERKNQRRNGGSDVALRERGGEEVACDPCVRMRQRGLSPLQENLLGGAA